MPRCGRRHCGRDTEVAATLGGLWVADWTRRAAASIHRHREELIELDRAIGDGDHGENLDRGYTAALKALDNEADPAPAPLLRSIAMALMSTVGGASGPLLGTAYLRMAGAAREDIGPNELVAMLQAACTGIQERGKAAEEEKTMVDAWAPAVRAAAHAAEVGGGCHAVLEAAARAAAVGAQSTFDMVATKGRASYLGVRSAGHLDPGAVSTSYILAAAQEAAKEETTGS
ncbi:dihydroxyacetone kinase subunit L [Actinobaculum sp. 313]|nr:dihydroxyacetone kinase subunit L [Actinobaculum sp. 313]